VIAINPFKSMNMTQQQLSAQQLCNSDLSRQGNPFPPPYKAAIQAYV